MGGHTGAVRAGIAPIVAVCIALLLASCAASPTTTYPGDTGGVVTVDWSDYPGHAGMVASEALQAPPAEELRAVSATVLAEIEDRLSAEFALDWEDSPTDGRADQGQFFPLEGNGYGGRSLYVTFNSAGRESLSIPTRPADWTRLVEIISDVTREYGLGAVTPDALDPERIAENAERSGTDDPFGQWQWTGTARGQSQWLAVTLVDIDRDTTGRAATEIPVDSGWNPRSVNISYGATTLAAADRDTFLERIAPFEGLPLPDSTTSD